MQPQERQQTRQSQLLVLCENLRCQADVTAAADKDGAAQPLRLLPVVEQALRMSASFRSQVQDLTNRTMEVRVVWWVVCINCPSYKRLAVTC